MIDGSSVPTFIKLLEPEEGFSNKKVYVYATDEDDVGHYELKITTTLGSAEFQDGLVP